MADIAQYRWILEIAMPIVTGVCGFFAGRRKKDNDFLGELQKSIDLLSAKNTEQIDEIIKLRSQIVTLREENLELSKRQESLIRENESLKEEINKLRDENAKQSERIEQLQKQLEGVKTITKVKQ